MKNEVSAWMKKAHDSQDASEFLLTGGYFSIAACQAFYTMFHSAKALLLSKGLIFTRELSVITAFGKEFKQADLLNGNFHKHLIAAREVRDNNDFQVDIKVSKQDATQLVQQSQEFYKAAQVYLSKQSQ